MTEALSRIRGFKLEKEGNGKRAAFLPEVDG